MKCASRSRLTVYVGTGLHIILGLLQLILVSIIFLVVSYNNFYYATENYKPLFVLPIIILAMCFLLRGFFILMKADSGPVSALEMPSSVIAGAQVLLFVSFLYLRRSFFDKSTEHVLTIFSSVFYSLDMILVVPFLVAVFLNIRRMDALLGGCEHQALNV